MNTVQQLHTNGNVDVSRNNLNDWASVWTIKNIFWCMLLQRQNKKVYVFKVNTLFFYFLKQTRQTTHTYSAMEEVSLKGSSPVWLHWLLPNYLQKRSFSVARGTTIFGTNDWVVLLEMWIFVWRNNPWSSLVVWKTTLAKVVSLDQCYKTIFAVIELP